MNRRRPSKPNLPSAPKPSELLINRVASNLIFSSLLDPAIAHCINQNELVPSELLPKYQNTSSLIWVWWDKDSAKCTSQGYVNGEGESRGIWRIKWWRLWMSQPCFFLGFLSQNSLWKLSTFREYKDIYSRVYKECEESVTTKQGILTTRARDWNESPANCLVKPEVLSCNATASVTLQLPLHASHVCHSGDLPVTRSSRETPLNWTLLRFLHILSHTTLTWIPSKYRVSNC